MVVLEIRKAALPQRGRLTTVERSTKKTQSWLDGVLTILRQSASSLTPLVLLSSLFKNTDWASIILMGRPNNVLREAAADREFCMRLEKVQDWPYCVRWCRKSEP